MAKNRKSACLSDLRTRILTLDIAPGSDLDEVNLCTQYGLSRTPLREVLQRLNGAGYVRLEQNRGAKVASMDLPVLRAFFQTAPLIYSAVARLAAENRHAGEIAPLRDIQKRLLEATATGNAGAAVIENHDFHARIGEMAHNIYLLPSLNRLLIDHTRLSQTFYRPTSPSERALVDAARDQHDAMISAIEQQEPARAVDLTLQHWDLSRNSIERFVKPDPLPHDMEFPKERRHAL